MDRYLTTEEAAKILGMHPGTLKNWRSQGLGPKFCKPQGAVRYRLSDIDDWMDNQSKPLTEEEENANQD
jgi:predicted DNA-binding transcriptional regulator AlpA